MKTNWQTKKLGEVCDLIKGKKPQIFVLKSNKPYLTAKVVRKTEIPKFVAENCPLSVWVKKEDIVIIMDGSNSGEMFTGLEGVLASTMGIVKYSKDMLTSKYLLYFLITHRENFTKLRTGAAIPHLNKEEFENLEIPLPPLPEQHRIVKILDEVFEGIGKAKENAEKNLKNSRELFESYLHDIFINNSWESVNFEGAIDKAVYTNKIQRKKFLESGKYPIISQEKDLINGYWNNKDSVFKVKKPVIIFGDHTKILKYIDFDFVLGADGVKIIQSKSFLDSKFLFYHLQSISLKSLGYARHYRLLKEIQIFFPKSLSEQKSIVKKLDALAEKTKKLEEIYKQKLAGLEELKKSVLQKAFSGEL